MSDGKPWTPTAEELLGEPRGRAAGYEWVDGWEDKAREMARIAADAIAEVARLRSLDRCEACGAKRHEDDGSTTQDCCETFDDLKAMCGKMATSALEARQRAQAAEALLAAPDRRELHEELCVLRAETHDWQAMGVKLAEAQQREAWWRELLDLEINKKRIHTAEIAGQRMARRAELRRLLGLEDMK